MTTITTAATVARKPLYTSLFVQVLTALLLGIVLGMAVPDFAVGLKIFSDAFLKLISMIVAPIVFCVVVHGISGAGDLKKVCRVSVEALSTVLFRAMVLVVRIAPLGVLGAVAYTVGIYGVGSLKQLISLVALFYISVSVFVLGVLGGVMALAGLNILKFLGYLREELTIVLATASSDAVLPQVMRKLERLGVKDSVVGLVIPTGYSFNPDSFSIYLTLAVCVMPQSRQQPLAPGHLVV